MNDKCGMMNDKEKEKGKGWDSCAGLNMDAYCPQLGMVIGFAYCMAVSDGLPCRNSVGCWKERLDIVAFLRERLKPEELTKAFGGLPKSRMERIVGSMNCAGKEER